METLRHIREFTRLVLESVSNEDLSLVSVVLLFRKGQEPDIPDVMTEIRIMPGVAIVRQTDPSMISPTGRDAVVLDIKFYSGDKEKGLLGAIQDLAKAIKRIPGIDIVRVYKINGRDTKEITDEQLMF